jgi:gamma-glutamyl:cysteine ligase YbdK (ATP-grasp superfamily)
MYAGVSDVLDVLQRRYHARLLGLGMHPFLQLGDAHIWTHRDRQIYDALRRIFNLNQHGWLNIQAYQLNIPFRNEIECIEIYNELANILPYIPAITAASPIYEDHIGDYIDNRLQFYLENQKEVPSITGDVIPDYVSSFEEYKRTTIERYSQDLAKANAPSCLLNKSWMNSRGAVIHFERRAIEIRVMDEQECIKSDVALSCYIRALLRGILINGEEFVRLPHKTLVSNFHQVIKKGLEARVNHPLGSTARQVCRAMYEIAFRNAEEDEKRFLGLVKRRIEDGSLSELILKEVNRRMQRTSFKEATLSIYSILVHSLEENRPWFA